MRKLWIPVLLMALAVLSYPLWKQAAKRSRWFLIATNVAQDGVRRAGLVSGQIGDNRGGALRDFAEVERALDTFHNYATYAGVSPQAFAGQDVFEVGPGDNLGVAILFAASGARRVVCQDRFLPLRDTPFHRELYQRLRQRLTEPERRAMDEAVSLEGGVRLHEQRLRHIYGRGVEEAANSLFGADSFDWIVSNAVLEEVYEIDQAMEAMHTLLRSGGHMVHKIDFGDYGMFSNRGFHPLEFLTIPDQVYRFMSQGSGQPNRRLINYYRDKLQQLGYRDVTLHITSIIGASGPQLPPGVTRLESGKQYTQEQVARLREIRPRLIERYRSLADEDLLAGGVVLVAQKP